MIVYTTALLPFTSLSSSPNYPPTNLTINPIPQICLILQLVSFATLNVLGIMLTKRTSSMTRAVFEIVRNPFVWIICLIAGWESFQWL